MASGDVAVANPTDVLGRKNSNTAPSRRSIISKITGGEEMDNPVSHTDALLRKREPGSPNLNGSRIRTYSSHTKVKEQGANGSGSMKEKSASPVPNINIVQEGGGSTGMNGNDNVNDNTIRRRFSNLSHRSDSDNRSNSSRKSARSVISGILQKSRSRQSSLEPESAAADDSSAVNGRSRRISSVSSRRMSLRMPKFRKGSSGGTSNPSSPRDDEEEEEAAVEREDTPPMPARNNNYAKESNGRKATTSPEKEVPLHPQSRRGNDAEKEEKDEQQGYVGGAIAAVSGATVAVGGVAAAIASRVTGQTPNADSRNNYDSEDSDDEFHDAEPDLHDIAEGDEEDHHSVNNSPNQGRVGRHRGISEGEGVAMSRNGMGARSGSPEPTAQGSVQSTAPLDGKRSSGGKRRSESAPFHGDATRTPVDAKAKKETPLLVREKAARVAKLTYDDVKLEEDEMRADIKVARGALHLFLNSRMFEAEEIVAQHSDRKLYYALGDALIAVIKGFMTFEPVDLAKAISYCKDSLYISSLLRKPSNSVASFGRFVRGTGQSPSSLSSMNVVQRHAELIYAESLLLKAVMGILYSGDFFAFVSEALNMRNAYGIYRSLAKYVEWADQKASGRRDETIDEDFRSGVHLGNGLISLILGLLPGKVLKIMEVIGYSGDTQIGLETLAKAGEWSKNKSQPGMKIEEEGVRRQVCDMGILLYHLVISTFIPVTGVDINYADKVLHYNLQRYPEGVFFLYFSGRLYSTQTMAEKGIVQYRAARDVQKEYVQLQHICYWDMALCHMSLTQWDQALECFDLLASDSNWSKCVYTYGRAVNMYMKEARQKEASLLFKGVPDKMQRIAGKSIPMEKYCARKAKKFIAQGRLLLPAIEFSYIYHCLTNAPRYSLCDNQLGDISEAIQDINEVEDPSQYHSGADEYWDDYCLAHFLRGVTLRYIAYPEKHAKVDPEQSPIPVQEAAEQAEISLRNVIDSSHRLSLDHYLCYFAHYELGRLRANQGKTEEAKEEFNLILSGKKLLSHKGKASLANMVLLRSNGALATL
ncbi:hypothetical protein CBS101457_001690 [Exobasidium rhododendri]|nr:hypothetical protein CBS101457_001690 [Exobasidium rhododendri]